MPSGYTSSVNDGTVTELKPFILQCARGMGALIMMRDEPWDAPIPAKFEPSDYNAKRLAEAKAGRANLYKMTGAECEASAKAEYEKTVQDNAKWEDDKRVIRERYLAMIDKVKAWHGAPEGIKEFALEQLNQSIDFDAPEGRVPWNKAKLLTGEQWRFERLEKLNRDIEYSAKADAEERIRTDGRNAWLEQLRLSLGIEL